MAKKLIPFNLTMRLLSRLMCCKRVVMVSLSNQVGDGLAARPSTRSG